MAPATQTSAFPNLGGHSFMRLTTFRKSGEPVPTPVWFAESDGRLYVTTLSNSGKVKRLSHTSRVVVEPCTAKGSVLGPSSAGSARILSPSEAEAADAALTRKYGFQKRAFDLSQSFRRAPRVYLEILPAAR
jgi:hypothetical protein